MNISHFSNNSLKTLHLSILDCLKKDNLLKKNGKDFLYGVKEYKDWKEWCQLLESEMTNKQIQFTPISFDD